jgi:hypothetical protein
MLRTFAAKKGMFSFAHGLFYGWGASKIKQCDEQQGSGSRSLQVGNSDDSGSDGGSDISPCVDSVDKPVLTIPCSGGGEAVASFMAAGCFQADVNCWQCGHMKGDLQLIPAFQHKQRCSCTRCKCIGCCARQPRGLTCA